MIRGAAAPRPLASEVAAMPREWGPELLVAAVFPVALPVLMVLWVLLSPISVLGFSYVYVLSGIVLAGGAYGVLRLVELMDRSSGSDQIVRLSSRLCSLGKLRGWDRGLSLILGCIVVVSLFLSPFGAAEFVLPVAVVMLWGLQTNLSRVDFDDLTDDRRARELKEARREREEAVTRARDESKDGEIPTLRVADGQRQSDFATLERAILQFGWSYLPQMSTKSRGDYQVELPVKMEHYREFRRLDHTAQGQHFESYALRPLALPDEELRKLAMELELLAREAGFCNLDTAGLALALAQNIPYRYDIDSVGQVEYARYPLETLVDCEGDCDCHAILAAALLVRMGFDTLLVWIPQPIPAQPDVSHLAVAVAGTEDLPGDQWYRFEGRKYYYVETTSPNSRLGEFPGEWNRQGHFPLRLR